jgi:hypothetical protein
MPVRNDDPPHEDTKLEAQLDSIVNAIKSSGVSDEFMESPFVEHIVNGVKVLLDAAWADGYASGMSDESMAKDTRASQNPDRFAPSATRPYRNIPLEAGDLDEEPK